MEMKSLIAVAERVLERSHYAVLITLSEDGRPHASWMTPTVIRGRSGFLYTVTSPDFRKVAHIRNNSAVTWLLQTKSLEEILEIQGSANVIDNPSLKSDVLEAIGGHMEVFWRVNHTDTDLVVVETAIEEISYFQPLKSETYVAALKS